MVLPFRDAFAVFPLRVLSVGAGELAFLDCGATDLAFLCGLPRVITKVDSKVRSLESPSCAGRAFHQFCRSKPLTEYPRRYGVNPVVGVV